MSSKERGRKAGRRRQPSPVKMGVSVDPPAALFAPDVRGKSRHRITNGFDVPLAIKIKGTDNRLYRIRPVHAVLPAGGQADLTIIRHPAPPKHDKLVIHALPAPEGLTKDGVPGLFKRGSSGSPVQTTLPLVVDSHYHPPAPTKTPRPPVQRPESPARQEQGPHAVQPSKTKKPARPYPISPSSMETSDVSLSPTTSDIVITNEIILAPTPSFNNAVPQSQPRQTERQKSQDPVLFVFNPSLRLPCPTCLTCPDPYLHYLI